MNDSPQGSKIAAFFDFDRTLIDVNSGLLYVKYERKLGRVSAIGYLRVALWMILYYLSIINMEKAYKAAMKHYCGHSGADLKRTTRTWFDREITHRLQPGAQIALNAHKEAGHPTIVLTTSSQYVSEAACDVFGMDASLAAGLVMDEQGLLTGDLDGPLCYGYGKVIRAEQWAKEANVDLDTSYFYSDSYSDVPMLERVGHPRVINPDFRLRRLAKKKGWPIFDWQEEENAFLIPNSDTTV